MKVSGQLHHPAALPQGKNPRYPLNMRLGEFRVCVDGGGGGGEEKKIPAPSGNRTTVVQTEA
jgi:hypothetical protein